MVCNRSCNTNCGCENNYGGNKPAPVRKNCQHLAKDVERALKDLNTQAEAIKCAFKALEEAHCIKPAHKEESNCGCNCGCNCSCNCGCIQPREASQCGHERPVQANCPRLAEDVERAICGLFAKIDAAEDAFEELVEEGCIRSNQSAPCNPCGCNCCCNRPCPR